MAKKKIFMSATATAFIASAFALPGASDATSLSDKTAEGTWMASVKHDLKVKHIDADEVIKKRTAFASKDKADKQVKEQSKKNKVSAEDIDDSGTYTVKNGDTLSEIAYEFDIDTEDLMKWNNLDSTIITPGQKLIVVEEAKVEQLDNRDTEEVKEKATPIVTEEKVAEPQVVVNKDRKAEENAERQAQAKANRAAEEQAKAEKAEAERQAAEQEQQAQEAAQAEEERQAKEEQERAAAEQAEAEQAQAEEEEAERVAEEEAEAEEAERIAEEQAAAEEEAQAEAERQATEEQEAQEAAQADADRLAEEEAQAEQEAEEAEAESLAEEETNVEQDVVVEEVEQPAEEPQENNEANASPVNHNEQAQAQHAEQERQAQAEEERKAKQEQERKAEEERKAQQEQERKAEEERKAQQEQERKAEEERKAKQEQERKAEEERKAKEEQERKAEEERKAKEEAEQNQGQGINGDLIGTAQSAIGTPYVWGGAQPGGFDCSGFIYWAHKESGNDVGRTSTDGYYNKSYMVDNPQVGDLVFFEGTYRSGISHMGIYVGGGQFIHAGTSSGVTVSSVNGPYWGDHFHSYKRFY